jgi:hypothetical protein
MILPMAIAAFAAALTVSVLAVSAVEALLVSEDEASSDTAPEVLPSPNLPPSQRSE